MTRYQLVDEATERQGIIGKCFYESNDENQTLQKLMELRDKHTDGRLVMVDTWKHRQIVAA